MSLVRSPESIIVSSLRRVDQEDPELAKIALALVLRLGHHQDYDPVGNIARDDMAAQRGEFSPEHLPEEEIVFEGIIKKELEARHAA